MYFLVVMILLIDGLEGLFFERIKEILLFVF